MVRCRLFSAHGGSVRGVAPRRPRSPISSAARVHPPRAALVCTCGHCTLAACRSSFLVLPGAETAPRRPGTTAQQNPTLQHYCHGQRGRIVAGTGEDAPGKRTTPRGAFRSNGDLRSGSLRSPKSTSHRRQTGELYSRPQLFTVAARRRAPLFQLLQQLALPQPIGPQLGKRSFNSPRNTCPPARRHGAVY